MSNGSTLAEEKRQKNFIACCCKEISREYPDIEVDLSHFRSISCGRGQNGMFFANDGRIVNTSEERRNRCKDSKSLDAVVYFRNRENRNHLEVYFYCKSTNGHGGSQDYIPHEIEITKSCILKNNNDSVVVAFYLEGSYWNDKSLIDECDFDGKKTFYVNQNNLKERLTNFLIKKSII